MDNEQATSRLPRCASDEGLEDTSRVTGKAGKSPNRTDLQDFKNINNSLMQDALRIWSDLWAELDSSGNHVLKSDSHFDSYCARKSQIVDGFEPSCGFSEFVKKMWILRSYLDFAKRISR